MQKKRVAEETARDDDARAALEEALKEEGQAEEAAPGDAGGEAEGEADVFRTQREIDAAMGRRLRKERERWEKRHAKALMLEETLGEGGVEEAIAAVLSQRMGLEPADVLSSMQDAGDPRELAEAAKRAALRKEAEALRGEDPEFDLEAALENPAVRALVEAGEPLRRAYAYAQMDRSVERARQEAKLEMMQAIRSRAGRPAALRAQGGYAGADVSNMSEAALRAIDERLKRGEKVRI